MKATRTLLLTLAAAAAVESCTRERAPDDAGSDDAARAARPADVRDRPPLPARFAVGRPASPAEIRAWDVDVGPDGRELPAGRGTWAQGRTVYAARCAACHGARGEGMGQGAVAYPRLIGRDPREGFPFGQDYRYTKTIGNYWPYATTLFDYVRRAMPLTAPGSLTDDETYSVVAYLLAENEIIGRDAVMSAEALRRVKMPARDRFVRDDRHGGPGFR